MKELCIDISHWDGDINLKTWKQKRDLWGVIVKFGGFETNLGRYRDSKAETNYNKAKAAQLHVGAYYYSVACSIADAKKDAEHFCSLLEGHDFDLPVYYDVEDPRQFQLSRRDLTDIIKTFCDAVNAKGYKAGLYTGGSAWNNNMYRDELFQYADWIASWSSNWPSYCEGDGGTIGMWQQGGIRLSDGDIVFDDVSGYNDCDWCVIDYPSIINGSGESTPIEENKQEERKDNNSSTIEHLMDIAYADLGYCADEDPNPGSKAGRYCAELIGEDWMAGPSREIWWCCMWVSMILDKAKVKCPGFPSQNTDVAWNGGASKRAIDKSEICRGDILIFDWNFATTATDHIGFATGSPHNGYVNTIEGNVSNSVGERVRPLSSIRYVIRPLYSDASTPDGGDSIQNPTQNGQNLEIDGMGGYNTTYELQSQLGTYADGVISGQNRNWYEYFEGMLSVEFDGEGSQMVTELQRRIGANPDGLWGPETSRKLQQKLIDMGYGCGAAGADGYFGHYSVMALQRSLNDGKWK